VISDLVAGIAVSTAGSEPSSGILDSLPDPMKPQLGTLIFVITLLVLLFFFLKHVLFQPLSALMDEREEKIRAGSSTKAKAASEIEARQADYAAKLRALRAQASERYKALTTAANAERTRVAEETRQQANAQREAALTELKARQESAKTDLMAQVEALSESMVQQLLKQA